MCLDMSNQIPSVLCRLHANARKLLTARIKLTANRSSTQICVQLLQFLKQLTNGNVFYIVIKRGAIIRTKHLLSCFLRLLCSPCQKQYLHNTNLILTMHMFTNAVFLWIKHVFYSKGCKVQNSLECFIFTVLNTKFHQ